MCHVLRAVCLDVDIRRLKSNRNCLSPIHPWCPCAGLVNPVLICVCQKTGYGHYRARNFLMQVRAVGDRERISLTGQLVLSSA